MEIYLLLTTFAILIWQILMEKGKHIMDLFHFCPVCGSADFIVNNEKSKRCLQCGFVYYLNPSAATVAVILNEKKELLVVRRAKNPAKGTLDLPGGFSDCDETSEEGVCREVMEETGLKVEKLEFLLSLPNLYMYSGLQIHTIDMFYLCHVKDTKKAKADDDAAELMWIPWNEIQPETFGLGSIRQGIEKLLTKKIIIK